MTSREGKPTQEAMDIAQTYLIDVYRWNKDNQVSLALLLDSHAAKERLEEARWWHGSDANVSRDHAVYHLQWEEAEGFKCAACERIAALEKAVNG